MKKHLFGLVVEVEEVGYFTSKYHFLSSFYRRKAVMKNFIRKINNLFWGFISDCFYVLRGDRSTMYNHLISVGRVPTWRAYARNPYCGIFRKFFL